MTDTASPDPTQGPVPSAQGVEGVTVDPPPQVAPPAAPEPDPSAPQESLGSKVGHVFQIIGPYVEEAVKAAETLFGPGTGASKKAWVESTVTKAVDAIIDGFIPGVLHGIVNKLVNSALDWMIDAAVTRLFPHS